MDGEAAGRLVRGSLQGSLPSPKALAGWLLMKFRGMAFAILQAKARKKDVCFSQQVCNGGSKLRNQDKVKEAVTNTLRHSALIKTIIEL